MDYDLQWLALTRQITTTKSNINKTQSEFLNCKSHHQAFPKQKLGSRSHRGAVCRVCGILLHLLYVDIENCVNFIVTELNLTRIFLGTTLMTVMPGSTFGVGIQSKVDVLSWEPKETPLEYSTTYCD